MKRPLAGVEKSAKEYAEGLMKVQKELNLDTDTIIDALAQYVVSLCLSEASDSYISYLNERIAYYMCKEGEGLERQ